MKIIHHEEHEGHEENVKSFVLASCPSCSSWFNFFLVFVLVFVPFARAAERPAGDKPNFALKSGDRVLFLGNTLIERDRYYGYLETMLTSRFHGQHIIFRNMGWSGDTVDIQERPLNFGSLEAHIVGYKPTVAFVSYGTNEAFDGPAGIPQFITGYKKILDMLEKIGARVVLLSPIKHENLGSPFPIPEKQNKNIEMYVAAIRKLAAEYHCGFLDYFHELSLNKIESERGERLTDDSVHLNASGYFRLALLSERQLGLTHDQRSALHAEQSIELGGRKPELLGMSVSDIRITATRAIFKAKLAQLPPPYQIEPYMLEATAELDIKGMANGRYVVKIDGRINDSGKESQVTNANTFFVILRPDIEQAEQLRQLIVHKNTLFFYRWRAHNGEYIYGRRAKGGGGNAGNEQFPSEMAKIEERIAQDEKRIAELAVPRWHTYELVPEQKEQK